MTESDGVRETQSEALEQNSGSARDQKMTTTGPSKKAQP
jgi:hypothetical protein